MKGAPDGPVTFQMEQWFSPARITDRPGMAMGDMPGLPDSQRLEAGGWRDQRLRSDRRSPLRTLELSAPSALGSPNDASFKNPGRSARLTLSKRAIWIDTPLCLLLIHLFGSIALAQTNWPRFRGAHAAGIGASGALPDHWSATNNVAGRTELPGRSWSSPIVWSQRLFTCPLES